MNSFRKTAAFAAGVLGIFSFAAGFDAAAVRADEGQTLNAAADGMAQTLPEAYSSEGSGGSDLQYIFVHGLSGWGSYDDQYKWLPYWGMLGGELTGYLTEQGFPAYAASVDPEGSAWDRACELYAQLAGTVVDYGKEHSGRCGHERFGRDYSSEPLIPDWDEGGKLVLIGHSFGGVTVRLFAGLLADGSAEEQAATDPEELSDFFRGGAGDRIHALVTLAAPTNGTTAYDMNFDPSFAPDSAEASKNDERSGGIFSAPDGEDETEEGSREGGRVDYDVAAYDMFIDNALALNERIPTLPGTYYFAVPCSATEENADGNQVPIRSMMESRFRETSTRMGSYSGVTAGGFVIDDSWKENDGLVNTVSAMAPIGAVSEDYEPGMEPVPGIWYVMPVHKGDHMSLLGGMMKMNNVRPFYLELLEMIDGLPRSAGKD